MNNEIRTAPTSPDLCEGPSSSRHSIGISEARVYRIFCTAPNSTIPGKAVRGGARPSDFFKSQFNMGRNSSWSRKTTDCKSQPKTVVILRVRCRLFLFKMNGF